MKGFIIEKKTKATDYFENAIRKIDGKAAVVLADKHGENYVDTAVKILIAIVIGALLLAGLYALFGDVVMPTLTERIETMFNYAG